MLPSLLSLVRLQSSLFVYLPRPTIAIAASTGPVPVSSYLSKWLCFHSDKIDLSEIYPLVLAGPLGFSDRLTFLCVAAVVVDCLLSLCTLALAVRRGGVLCLEGFRPPL